MAIECCTHLYEHLYAVPDFMARLSNPFGPHQLARHDRGVIAVLLQCAMPAVPFSLIDDGSSVQDYLFVEDVLDALNGFATYDGPHRVFNIGSGEGHSLTDLIAIVEQETPQEIAINSMPSRAIDVPTDVLNVSLAAEQIGWARGHLIAGGSPPDVRVA